MFDTEKFIGLVEEWPLIWDKNNEDYNNKILKDQAWEYIGDTMHPHGEKSKRESELELKAKWKNIRDAYNKYCKQGDNAAKKTKYAYADALAFLSMPVKKNRQREEITKNHIPLKKPEAHYEPQQTTHHQTIRHHTTHHQTTLHESPIKKRHHKELTSFQSLLLQKLDKTTEKEDPDRCFLLSILPDFKKLSPHQKNNFKKLTISFFDEIYKQQSDFIPDYNLCSLKQSSPQPIPSAPGSFLSSASEDMLE